MKELFDYGEFIICIGPIFLVMAVVGLALLWNAIPPRKERDERRAPKSRKDETR